MGGAKRKRSQSKKGKKKNVQIVVEAWPLANRRKSINSQSIKVDVYGCYLQMKDNFLKTKKTSLTGKENILLL